jgi:hypothetical protein
MKTKTRWLLVAAYATAMAWVESAVVFYLRTQSNRIVPYQPDPLPLVAGYAKVELLREAATLLMLACVGALAGTSRRSRLGYAAIAFGIWDVFYYVFLKLITGWPHSLRDWDILFLIPLPWWGPVIAPVLISMIMIVWGTLATQLPGHASMRIRDEWKAWLPSLAGMMLALYVFMEDSIHALRTTGDSVRTLLPSRFDWKLFCVSLLLMCMPVLWNAFQNSRQKALP